MKKSIKHLYRCCIACAAILLAHPCIYSQVSNPSQWETFVQSSDNSMVRDTFRLQTFAGKSTDNWEYTSTGNVTITDLSHLDHLGKRGEKGLQISLKSQVEFSPYDIHHQDVFITLHYAGHHLMPNENITVRTYREGENKLPQLSKITEKDFTLKFGSTSISRSPKRLDIIIPQPASNTKNGCYFIDSIYAHGLVPKYSLFTGKGKWTELGRWSHLPAERHRTALIKGDVSIDTNIYCNNLSINNGSINLASTGELHTNEITIHSNDQLPYTTGNIFSSGNIYVNGKIIVQKTFAEKGKWYFISFPFDVFASGFDPNFQMGDDTKETDGNYFYVRMYNSDKRSSTQSASNNWEVITANNSEDNQPIFRKNTGYLIAIDANATTNTLSFSSKSNDLPAQFGKNGEVTISISSNSQDATADHSGWFLCGNPLPSPLSLRTIETNAALDGYIYVYDGSSYQPYAIGSDYSIPPFSAFFVKASQNTSLIVQARSDLKSSQMLSSSAPMTASLAEPRVFSGNSTSNQDLEENAFAFLLRNRSIIIRNSPSTGTISIYRSNGSIVWKQFLPKGNSMHTQSLPAGVYIILIQTEKGIIQEKIRINP